MSCFNPVSAVLTERLNKNGNRIVEFGAVDGEPIFVKCNNCIGCRLDYSREWATRITHEAQLHDDNCFITLTYNDDNIPRDGSLVKKDIQNFIKRLRKSLEMPYCLIDEKCRPVLYKRGKKKGQPKMATSTFKKIKYYYCGEYGDKNNRPHYHAIIFNHNFNDWVYLHTTDNGSDIYTSPTLEKIWGKGFVTIGTVTFESAAYIARYCVKKINGKMADTIDKITGLKPYERCETVFGEIVEIYKVLPEFADMSRRPGIGRDWFNKYRSDCYPKDYTTINGMRIKPPKAYDRYLQEIDEQMYDEIKNGRMLSAFNSGESDESRLNARRIVKEAQYSKLKRQL
jgi:hypothetical protein